MSACAVASTALTLAWLVGLVLSDRFGWSQWVSWIPAVVVVAASTAALTIAWLGPTPRSRVWSVAGVAAVVLAAAWVAAREVGWRRHERPPQAIRVLQWNTNWPAGGDPRSEKALAEHPADIVLLTNATSIVAPDRVAEWAGAAAHAIAVGPFTIVTRWPVVEAAPVAAGGEGGSRWSVARFQVLPPGWARPMRIAMVDLPSRPWLPKAAVAETLMASLGDASLPAFDLVAGDFNATERSGIIDRCFPGMVEATQVRGEGWLATWPRKLPLWRIDHVLVGGRLTPAAAFTLDPGVSQHRMTMAMLMPRRPVRE